MDDKMKDQLDSISKSIDQKIETSNIEIVETLVQKQMTLLRQRLNQLATILIKDLMR